MSVNSFFEYFLKDGAEYGLEVFNKEAQKFTEIKRNDKVMTIGAQTKDSKGMSSL